MFLNSDVERAVSFRKDIKKILRNLALRGTKVGLGSSWRS